VVRRPRHSAPSRRTPNCLPFFRAALRANGNNYSAAADSPTMTAVVPEAPAVKLQTIARRLPEEIWAIFEPLLPPVVWCGEGRPPASNHKCLHGLL
jgi:hypothetical protein